MTNIQKIRIRTYFFIIISLLVSATCYAAEVVLTSGERFTTSKVWEENGKIRFNMNGLIVSVDKSDVSAVYGSGNSNHISTKPASKPKKQPRALTPPDSVSKPKTALEKPVPKEKKPPPSMTQPKKEPPKTPLKKAKARGIGIRGLSWHMRPNDLGGLTKIKTEPDYGGIDQYQRMDGPMTMGNVLLDGLVFGFWRNRLYSITIWVEGKPAYTRLQKMVFDRYGPGHKSKKREDRYVWTQDKTTDRMLEFDKKLNIGLYWMRSRELADHIKEVYPDPQP